MLLREHARRQRMFVVARQHRHHGLGQDRAMVEFGRDLVHGSTGELAAGVNRALVRVQPREGRQQRGMDVEQAAFVMVDQARCQDAHETGQHHQRRLEAVDRRHQCGIKRLA